MIIKAIYNRQSTIGKIESRFFKGNLSKAVLNKLTATCRQLAIFLSLFRDQYFPDAKCIKFADIFPKIVATNNFDKLGTR